MSDSDQEKEEDEDVDEEEAKEAKEGLIQLCDKKSNGSFLMINAFKLCHKLKKKDRENLLKNPAQTLWSFYCEKIDELVIRDTWTRMKEIERVLDKPLPNVLIDIVTDYTSINHNKEMVDDDGDYYLFMQTNYSTIMIECYSRFHCNDDGLYYRFRSNIPSLYETRMKHIRYVNDYQCISVYKDIFDFD